MFKTMKKAVKVILVNGWSLGTLLEWMKYAQEDDYDLPGAPNETVLWAYRALQWCGFKAGNVPPYCFPKEAFKYERTLHRVLEPLWHYSK